MDVWRWKVSQQSINQYENHSVEPDISILSRMADYFHTSIDYIVGCTENRKLFDPAVSSPISHDEAKLLEQYRALKSDEKQCINLMLQTLLKP